MDNVKIILELDESHTYFSILFYESLRIDLFELEWDYDDASKLRIEFDEHAGRKVGAFIKKGFEQEIITKVLIELKRNNYTSWDKWGFEDILKARIAK